MLSILLIALLQAADDAAATSALDAFSAAWGKAKTSDAKVAAIGDLGKSPHDKVAARLIPLLTVDDKPSRSAAAAALGTFNQTAELKKTCTKGLASALNAGTNVSESEVRVAILAAIGALQDDSGAAPVRNHFDDKDIKVCTAAVTAAGQIRNKTLIDALLDVLKECEAENKKNAVVPATGKSASSAKNFVPPKPTDAEKHKKDRVAALAGPAQSSLGQLTGQSLRTADEFEKWWSKNKGTYK